MPLLAKTGVTSNAISPRLIWTEMIDKQADAMEIPKDKKEREQKLGEWVSNTWGRLGRVEDIGNAVIFVVNPKADYINCANIRVDGDYELG
ncbi:MAG: SDR family oxidoreductase [Nostoc sp.]|uniref:SDR family oxidoreductase n=1 Tax=Nostoc sp. TaxID=1180 RepID=UPI002FFA71B0